MTINVKGQITETYFSDLENKEGGKINDYIKGDDYIIIGGQSFDNYPGQPSVTKIDTLGNIVWSTTSFDSTVYSSSNVFIHRLMLSSGYLYATCIINQWPNYPKEVWKIDATNGNIIWKKPFDAYNYRYPEHIIDFDANKFLIGYSDDYNGSVYKIRFAFINKSTGDTLSSHRIGDISWTRDRYGLAVDSQKNIYYSKQDSIFKVDSSNPDSIVWGVQHISADVLDFQHIYIDQNDSIFLFGRQDAIWERGKAIAITKNSGSLIWNVNASTGDVAFEDMVDKNGYIHTTWRHTHVGGGSFNFWTNKIDKLSGNVAWNSSYSFSGVGTSDSHSGNGEGAMSIDVDNDGSVFLTGYYGDANYGPENWGILKLDGNTGNDIYELTITEDSVKYDNISVGMAACVINNKPYFVGELQTHHPNYNERSKATFIKIDGNSGNVLVKKYIGGEYQFPSKTIQIENYGTNKTIALKQIGRFSNLELYDFNKNLVWEKLFIRNYMLFGSDLVVDDESGTIYFSAYSVDESSSAPYFSEQTDSIYVFKIDSLGNLENDYSFYLGVNDAKPTEIINDGINTYIFYHKYNTIYYRKIDGSGLSSEHSLNITYNNLASQTKNAINHTDSTILVFGYHSNVNRVIELNKNTLSTVNLATIPSIHKINYIDKNSANNVILCGQDINNNDVLISYNTMLLDTLWTNSYSPQSEIYKFTYDEDSSFIYSIGTESDDVILRKIETSNGLESWTYSYNGPSNLTEEPLDIVFDKFRNQLVYTGYQLNTSSVNINKSVLIETIDTSGVNTNTYIKYGDFDGDNIGICAHVLKDGSVWTGGNLNHSIYGKAGFVYEIDSSLIILSIDENYLEYGLNSVNIKAYPNPFLDFINVSCRTDKNNSNVILTIHNIEGKTIYSEHFQHQQIGKHNYQINTTELIGIYLLTLQLDSQVLTCKIISAR